MTTKYNSILKALAISFIISSASMAATYDIKNENKIIENPLFSQDQIDSLSPFFEAFQQSEVYTKKEDYTKTLNLIKNKQLSEAKSLLEELIKKSPDEAEYYNLKALVEIQEKNISDAQQSYFQALEINPDNQMSLLGLATLALEKNNFKKAKTYLEKTLTINEESVTAYLLLADIATKQNKTNEVERILLGAADKVEGVINKEIKIATNLVKFYVLQKQPKKAFSVTEKLFKHYPDNNEALSLLARAQILNQQNTSAEKTLFKLINKDAQDSEHRILLAQLLLNQPKKEKKALQFLKEAADIDPKNPVPLAYQATFFIKQQQFQKALKLAKKLDSQFPKLTTGKMLKADIYLAEKKIPQALDINLKAYQQQPTEKLATTIVSLMTHLNKKTDAIKFLKQELTKTPNNNAFLYKIATLYQQNKDFEKAASHYQSVLANIPDHIGTLNNLAWVYSQQNNPQALELAKKAYNKIPESAFIADTYGYILTKQGNKKEGLKILKQAGQLAPKQYDIQFHLAQAYHANGNINQAIAILESILKENKPFSEKESATNLLVTLKKEI